MSETCGGCVYDGTPLRGITIRIDGEAPGRINLGGPMVAAGYRGLPDHPAFTDTGWFRTDDLGQVGADGMLTVIGRADEAITTGGLTIVPQVVEAVLLSDPSISDCAVLGLPDDRLGEKVVAAVVAARGAQTSVEAVKAFAAQHLDRTAVPREVRFVDDLPRRGPGKVDRAALRTLLT
jgi:o-succinylbenzoate---CoA ligase